MQTGILVQYRISVRLKLPFLRTALSPTRLHPNIDLQQVRLMFTAELNHSTLPMACVTKEAACLKGKLVSKHGLASLPPRSEEADLPS